MLKCLFPSILLLTLWLTACSNPQEEVLCKLQTIYDEGKYEEADSLLQKIDSLQLKKGSELQARYALLYTKIKYKNYVDAPNDSLISISVEYAEAKGDAEDCFYAYLYQGIVRYELQDYPKATQSLLCAMLNAADVEDHYSKGQMYTYLTLVNDAQQCSDDYQYAHKAYLEYREGQLHSYAVNAMNMMALAKLRVGEMDSCRFWLDSCTICADQITHDHVHQDILSAWAQYYLLSDSIEQAENAWSQLLADESYSASARDILKLALLNAEKGNLSAAEEYLSSVDVKKQPRKVRNLYYAAASRICRIAHNYERMIPYEDSLNHVIKSIFDEVIKNSSNAYQRDYTESKLKISEARNTQKMVVIGLLILIILLLVLIFGLYNNKKLSLIKMQQEKIAILRLQGKQDSTTRLDNLSELKTCDAVLALKMKTETKDFGKIDWEGIDIAFEQKLPYFEKTLLQLTSLSSIEWRVCMLLKLGFKPIEIAKLLNHSPNAITNIRSRLYKKVFKKEGNSTLWDNFIKEI